MKANPNDNDVILGDLTLTKREYFAAMAMQGLLANPQTPKDIQTYNLMDGEKRVACSAVRVANALIEELTNDN